MFLVLLYMFYIFIIFFGNCDGEGGDLCGLCVYAPFYVSMSARKKNIKLYIKIHKREGWKMSENMNQRKAQFSNRYEKS